MSNLLTLSYWFSRTAPKLTGTQFNIIVGVVVGLIILGVVFKIIMMVNKLVPLRKMWRRLGNLFITMGMLVGLSLFFTQTATPLLGARWWFLLWLLVALVWAGYITYYGIWQMPKILKADAEHKEFAKYLPKKS